MIKICHISSAHKNDDARIFRLESVSLTANEYEVYFVVAGESKNEQGVHIVGLGKQPVSRIKRMFFFTRKAYKKALDLDCDIYHIHDPELLPYAIKLKSKGKTVIFDSHENTLEQMAEKKWIPPFLRGIVSRIYKNYAKKVFAEMDCLVSVTPHIVEQLKEINANTYMITNYPLLKCYPPRLSKSNEDFNICFTGGLDEQWNHETIINAINDIDGVRYTLCGWGSDEYIYRLKHTPGWKKVNYLGRVSFEKATEVQSNSDIGMALLSPSNNTGGNVGTIGNTKLFEYMMAGLPLLCTDFLLWKNIIDKYHCGIYVPFDDIAKLKEAIIYLRNHPQEARKMGEKGRRAVETEYNWKTQEKILLDMYSNLLNK